jgi:hypothetical protein
MVGHERVRVVMVHAREDPGPVGGCPRPRRNMVTVYCASSGQPGGRTCTHTVPATPVSLSTGSARTLRMHRLVAALVALIESARRCGQVCTGYGVVARTFCREDVLPIRPRCLVDGGGASEFWPRMDYSTYSSTRVPRTPLPKQWRCI